MSVNQTKVQIDRRNDGLITMTIKLVGWDLNRLRASSQESPSTQWADK